MASVDTNDIYRDGRELAKIADSVVVEVPLVDDAVVAIRRLAGEGVRVSATLVFNAAQALLAAKAGAAVVTIPIDQLDGLGQDSVALSGPSAALSRLAADRAARVQQLSAAVRSGSYSVSSAAIGSALLRHSTS